MPISIRTTLSNELKVKYRKVKTVPAKIKAVIYSGVLDPAASIQFNSDVGVYGLYEALLLCESMENDGYIAPGTVEKAAKLLK